MKKFMLLSILSLLFVMTYAQTATKPSPEQYLTTEQLIKYQSDLKIAELEKKITTYGNWVGVGGEVGLAVREGLTAVVDVSDKFSKTDVGKFTMFMIAWKIMGDNMFAYAFGILYFIITTITFIRIFRRLIRPRRVMIENPGFFKFPKKYQIINAPFHDSDSVGLASVIFVIAIVINVGIACAIMF